jgi:hypothetical protein
MSWIFLRPGYIWFLSLLIFTVLIELSGGASAQPYGFQGGSRRHGGQGSQDLQGYDPQTVTTVKGQVDSLGSYGMTGWRVAPGMRTQGLVLKTEQGNVTVNLGPPWYVHKQDFTFKPGDALEVTGSKVARDDQTMILAAQVKKEGQTLKVRDENGKPLWHEHDHGGGWSGGMGKGGMGSGGRGYGRGPTNW